MNSIFHRAKHWQLFVILVGGVLSFYFLGIFSFLSENLQMNRPPNIRSFFWFFIPMMFITVFITFGWQWSIGSGLKNKLPRGVRMNFKLFRAFTIVPILYMILYVSFIFYMLSRIESMVTQNPFEAIQTFFAMFLGVVILMPIGLFAVFCMFYNFYFCAKTLKSIELGREAELNDYIGYYFLFWFNFVGFWIIQPSVNAITSPDWTPPPTPPGYEPIIDLDPTFQPIPQKEVVPRGDLLKTRDHEAFEHDDDFDGLF